MQKHEPKTWYKLDNAAKLYPAIKSRKWTAVYRVSAKLTAPIDKPLLERALATTTARMGIFSCRLRAGVFWYYFDANNQLPAVIDDAINPCIRLYTKDCNGYLWRLRTHGCTISLEVFHSVSDGFGGITFLKTLIAQYLKLKGFAIPATHGVLDCSEPPHEEEAEDAFLKYYNKKAVRSWKETRAFHLKGAKEKGGALNVIRGIVSVSEIKAVAKKHNVSLTEFLVGVFMYALYRIQTKQQPRKIQPIKVSVPINLRQFFSTKTLRNFSSYTNPEINANWGEYTFEEVLRTVHYHMRHELSQKSLSAKMSKNVKSEKSLFVRMLPLPIKNMAISFIFHMAGESRITSTLSNVGMIDVPKEMAAHIERFDAMLGAPRHTGINCVACAYADALTICFSSIFVEAQAEREFFTFLVKMGIHVKLESNKGV